MINDNKKMEGLKMGNELKNYIELIACFSDSNRFYWINALSISNVVKGKLIVYFNL